MQFNSLTYMVFFFALYLLYRVTPRHLQNLLLLIASYVFYAWWDVRFLFLIILSTVVNYCCAVMFRAGVMSAKQRLGFSVWILAAFTCTVLVQWNYMPIFRTASGLGADWRALMPPPELWKVLGGLCVAILLINLAYPKLVLLNDEKKRNLVLFFGVLANLLILGFFKYCNFFIDNIEWLLTALGVSPSRFHLNIILPIGVSFYTFKGISYVVDTYRGQLKTAHPYSDFALYMAFFPSLLAGPIDRASGFLQQICEKRNLGWDQSVRGLHLFLYGLFKKVVIADGVVRTVSSVFDSTGQASWIDVVVATALFTIQIYCDFSGYTDMARGTAKVLGIDLMVNFRSPYFSKNPREFWSRWHISLSTWLRDYLYIPLGGNRNSHTQTYRNLLITMVLGGLWHGAAWNFVLWGLYHGIGLSTHRAFSSVRSAAREHQTVLYDIAKVAFSLIFISYGWLLFRAPSLHKIVSLTSTLIFDFGNMNLGASRMRLAAALGLPIFLAIEIVEKLGEERPFYQKMPVPAWTALYAAVIFCIAVGLTTESTRFIYMVF